MEVAVLSSTFELGVDDFCIHVPNEVMLSIFIDLAYNIIDLLNVYAVCRRWNRLSSLIFDFISWSLPFNRTRTL